MAATAVANTTISETTSGAKRERNARKLPLGDLYLVLSR